MNDRRIRLPYWIEPIIDITRIVLLVALPAVVGCGIILFQIYAYLRFSTWVSISVIDAAAYFSDDAWLSSPSDWNGLHSLLNMVPASLVLLFIAYSAQADED
ncbi:hypothetical protein D3C87_1362380 [compost metagenome]|jgi:hypothetical protein|uniref:hypothetical protein n=1 Tax=Agrobacterium tumefaciens complex TaxID=1183400 RepID=UPI0007612578|nr:MULTISPECIES: hypothetical protein [Agrobacterium tumefaciens complex]KAB0462427.1 hypothetical protein F7R04_02270 [Agrobacterium tumefaciens]KWT80533.1 hypothetical protein ASH09_04605 [Agrobacterium radiobacter]MBP2570231.1 hypothetical protein [Agrobacterium tumefaciens]NIB09240.1 hypothetical protein [Agrobacterium radiobacter]NTE66633.1 hypothetical protein [Agrobacterium tumefaciens]